MSYSILIDRKGNAWPDHSWELARHLGYRHPTLGLAAYAVEKRGFIHLRGQESGVRIALRAGRVKLVTVLGAILALTPLAPRRIVLALLSDGEWVYEMMTSQFEFAERAEQLAADGPIDVRQPFLAVERDIAALSSPLFCQVRPLMSMWQATRGRLPEDFLRSPHAAGLVDRLILVRGRGATSHLIRDHVGDGIRLRDQTDASSMIGTDVDDLPDRDYGVVSSRAYYESYGSSRPRLESVHATVRISQAAVVRGRYDRLLMPWRGSGDDALVMCVSIRRKLSFVA